MSPEAKVAKRRMMRGAVVAVLLIFPASAAASAGWSAEPTPEPALTVNADFADVSCVSSSFCMAVGTFVTSSRNGQMYSLWNGSVWSRGQAIGSVGVRSILLRKVSCASSSQCVAVGYLIDETGAELPVAEHWNGSTWMRDSVPVPGPENDNPQLTAVDCVAADSCFAVGGSGADSPFAARWDGSSWTSQAFGGPLSERELSGISCSSATACVAIGNRNTSAGGFAPLVAMFDGSHWTLHNLPEPAGATSSQLFGVSCAQADDCVAVGYAQSASLQRPMTTMWDGTSWREHASPAPHGTADADLAGVSCTPDGACTAVGVYTVSSSSSGGWAERWDGASWTLEPSATPATVSVLDGVSCTSDRACTAVGSASDGSGQNSTLAEGWGGPAWAALPVPSPPTMKFAQLFGTSCASVDWCVAVGQFDRSSDGAVVAFGEFWDGSSWRILPRVPLPAGTGSATLLGVSCPLVDQCVAVGSYTRVADSHVLPLAVGWNGRAWTLISSAGPSAQYSQLDGVWCQSISSCETVGFSIPSAASGVSVPLVEQLSDGTTIVLRVPLPPQNTGSALHGVSCDPSLNCVAVGNSDQGHGEMPLSYRLPASGTWTIMDNPNGGDGAGEDDLFGVSCLSFTSCVATGVLQISSETPLAQLLHDTTWTDLSPGRPSHGAFKAISCPATGACTAVGYRTTSTQTLTLAERWDGTRWTTQITPDPGSDDILYGTACPTRDTCLAVGTISDAHTPLAEIFS